MTSSLDAFYLTAASGRDGQRFCVLHAPASGPARGAVVYVQPFAEEMNKTRRMAALNARALADAGWAVLQVDLHGCGDSSGDFGDATWAGWVDDVVQAARWMVAKHPGPLWLWGLRAGCLIAVEAAARIGAEAASGFDQHVDLLLWQPVAAGKQHLQQFLRLKVAGDMIAGRGKGVMDEMKAALARGEAVDVAGYALPADVAAGLERATLSPPPNVGRVVVLEVSSQAEATMSPATDRALGAWRERGIAVDARVVAGPAFWQTTEIETAPALIAAGLDAMARVAEAVAA